MAGACRLCLLAGWCWGCAHTCTFQSSIEVDCTLQRIHAGNKQCIDSMCVHNLSHRCSWLVLLVGYAYDHLTLFGWALGAAAGQTQAMEGFNHSVLCTRTPYARTAGQQSAYMHAHSRCMHSRCTQQCRVSLKCCCGAEVLSWPGNRAECWCCLLLLTLTAASPTWAAQHVCSLSSTWLGATDVC